MALLKAVDSVLLLDVLEHMYNPWAELRFLRQHLPRGAQGIVSLPNIGHINILGNLAAGNFFYEPAGILDITHVRFFTLPGVRAMFEQTGFEVQDATVISGSQCFRPDTFPTKISSGKLSLRVDSPEEWQVLSAVQFGFRLGWS